MFGQNCMNNTLAWLLKWCSHSIIIIIIIKVTLVMTLYYMDSILYLSKWLFVFDDLIFVEVRSIPMYVSREDKAFSETKKLLRSFTIQLAKSFINLLIHLLPYLLHTIILNPSQCKILSSENIFDPSFTKMWDLRLNKWRSKTYQWLIQSWYLNGFWFSYFYNWSITDHQSDFYNHLLFGQCYSFLWLIFEIPHLVCFLITQSQALLLIYKENKESEPITVRNSLFGMSYVYIILFP